MPEATFPTPLHSTSYDTGPLYLKYLKRAKDWSTVTVISTFEDQGVDTNESAVNAPQFWDLEYDGLEDEDANILDQFWDAHRRVVPFTFIEPRDHPWTGVEGDTVTGCYFWSYEKDHTKVWIQSRKIVIVKFPS